MIPNTTTPIHTCENCGSDNVEVEYSETADLYEAVCHQCGRATTFGKGKRMVTRLGKAQPGAAQKAAPAHKAVPSARSIEVPNNANIGGYQTR